MKKAFSYSILILFFFITFNSCNIFKPDPPLPLPPTGSVSGTIYDNKKVPLENAKVSISGGNSTIPTKSTSTKGEYSFSYVDQNDNYLIKVEKDSYITQTTGLKVGVGAVSGLDFSLKKVFEISPEAGLDFGSNDRVKKFDLRNNSANTVGLTMKINNTWITVEPTTAQIPPNSIFPITVVVDDKGKAAAKYDGSITLNFDNNIAPISYNISMFVPNAEAPSVTSDKPTNITPTTAQITGTIISSGKGTISKYGHVWGENANPTCCVPNFFTDFGSRSVGSYVSTLAGLVKGKTYFVRAYAQNEKGINYSYNDEYSFTTPTTATEPSVSIGTIEVLSTISAKATGKINDNGGSPIVEYGHVWSKTNPTPDPDVEKTKTSFKGEPTNGDFISNIDNLLESNTKYYIVAYAKNSSSKPLAKSAVLTFNTPLPVIEPKLTTSAATDIDYTSVTLKGSVTELGSSKIVEHGFVYSKSNADPKVNAKNSTFKNLGNLSNPNPISTIITGLLKGMSYYYRTYVKTENGDYYYASSIKTITTKEDDLVYYWTFNDFSFGDSTPNNIDADGSSKPTSDRFSNANKSMDLSSGPMSEIQVNRTFIPGEMTVSLWVKMSESNFSGSKKVIYGHSDGFCLNSSYWTGFMIYFDPSRADGTNNILLYLSDDDAGFSSTSKPIYQKSDIVFNTWQQLVFVKSGTKWRFYLDGDPVSQELSFNIDFKGLGSFAGFSTAGSKSFLGQTWAGCNEGFSNLNGQVDDVRRYNKAFSATEVLELYNREK